jgi:DNA-binding XRE family transcriptional regulator
LVNRKITQKKKEYTVVNSSHRILDMEFPQRLSAIRKEKGLTQQKLAKLVGLHVAQVRRYEGGTSQPTLELIMTSDCNLKRYLDLSPKRNRSSKLSLTV